MRLERSARSRRNVASCSGVKSSTMTSRPRGMPSAKAASSSASVRGEAMPAAASSAVAEARTALTLKTVRLLRVAKDTREFCTNCRPLTIFEHRLPRVLTRAGRLAEDPVDQVCGQSDHDPRCGRDINGSRFCYRHNGLPPRKTQAFHHGLGRSFPNDDTPVTPRKIRRSASQDLRILSLLIAQLRFAIVAGPLYAASSLRWDVPAVSRPARSELIERASATCPKPAWFAPNANYCRLR